MILTFPRTPSPLCLASESALRIKDPPFYTPLMPLEARSRYHLAFCALMPWNACWILRGCFSAESLHYPSCAEHIPVRRAHEMVPPAKPFLTSPVHDFPRFCTIKIFLISLTLVVNSPFLDSISLTPVCAQYKLLREKMRS